MCLSAAVKALAGVVEDLDEIWDILDMCYDRPEEYCITLKNISFRFMHKKYQKWYTGAMNHSIKCFFQSTCLHFLLKLLEALKRVDC